MRCKIPAQLDARLFDEKPPLRLNAKAFTPEYKRRQFHFQREETVRIFFPMVGNQQIIWRCRRQKIPAAAFEGAAWS